MREAQGARSESPHDVLVESDGAPECPAAEGILSALLDELPDALGAAVLVRGSGEVIALRARGLPIASDAPDAAGIRRSEGERELRAGLAWAQAYARDHHARQCESLSLVRDLTWVAQGRGGSARFVIALVTAGTTSASQLLLRTREALRALDRV